MIRITLALLAALVLYAFNSADVLAGARSGHASCGVPELAFCDVPELGCSEPAAACGAPQRSILVADCGRRLGRAVGGFLNTILPPYRGEWRIAPSERRLRRHGCN